MNWRQIDDRYVLRLDPGEGVIDSLSGFASERGINSGVVSGIGGIEDVVLGYFDLGAKEYLKRKLDGIYEMISLAGNVSTIEGRPFVHAHAVVSGRDMTALGGHLFEARVAITAELYLWGSPSQVTRSLDERVGLNTLDL
jgi:predicted DNA-binding protein with PD1-like motif